MRPGSSGAAAVCPPSMHASMPTQRANGVASATGHAVPSCWRAPSNWGAGARHEPGPRRPSAAPVASVRRGNSCRAIAPTEISGASAAPAVAYAAAAAAPGSSVAAESAPQHPRAKAKAHTRPSVEILGGSIASSLSARERSEDEKRQPQDARTAVTAAAGAPRAGSGSGGVQGSSASLAIASSSGKLIEAAEGDETSAWRRRASLTLKAMPSSEPSSSPSSSSALPPLPPSPLSSPLALSPW